MSLISYIIGFFSGIVLTSLVVLLLSGLYDRKILRKGVRNMIQYKLIEVTETEGEVLVAEGGLAVIEAKVAELKAAEAPAEGTPPAPETPPAESTPAPAA